MDVIASLDVVSVVDGRTAEQHYFEGNAHLAAQAFARAEASFRCAIGLAPRMAEAHANLAWLLARTGAVEEADQAYRQARALNPVHAGVCINHGAFLAASQRFAEAEAAYVAAIAAAPESAPAWSNLGALYLQTRHWSDAERCCRRSIGMDPAYAKPRLNLSYALLMQGRFDEGWRHYESRPWRPSLAESTRVSAWRGESLRGRSLIVRHEGGLGDMIQFCRYVAVLKRMGARRVGLTCPPALIGLLAMLQGVDDLFACDADVPCDGWDFQVPLMSLPLHCGTRIGSIPATLPYLSANEQSVARLKPLQPSKGLRVGLAWQGNPAFENDAHRSIHDTTVLASLGRIDGVSWVNLQQGVAVANLPLQHIDGGLDDFASTAALVQGLDLVITVDTAVAHLAGALGKPCWVMLPHHLSDWRWLDARDDSPWYPGVMRLMRQPAIGDWPSVISEIASALVALVDAGEAVQADGSPADQAGCSTTSSADAAPLPALRMVCVRSTA